MIANRYYMIFFKWANPGLFYHLLLVFSNKYHCNFKIKYIQKCPFTIQSWDLNPRPLEHESPPITTRPELLPNIFFKWAIPGLFFFIFVFSIHS